MKANELSCRDLMVDDWVYLPSIMSDDKYPVQVLEIQDDCIKYYCGDKKMMVGFKYIEPIPLTLGILEKNGMHLYNRNTKSLMEWCNHSGCFKEDENYRVELSIDNDGKIRWTINGDEYTIMPLDYVHQLQQALRLCGINHEIIL